jgi:hypothetical protein
VGVVGAGQPAPVTGTLGAMQIVSALFVENFEMRRVRRRAST